MSICKALILIVLSLALARVSRADVHQLLPETLQSEGHQRYLTTESRQAAAFAKSWGITSGRSFLSLAGTNESVEEAFGNKHSSSLVVALIGNKMPKRRAAGSAFITLVDRDTEAADALGLTALNGAIRAFETAAGRQLCSFRLIPRRTGLKKSLAPYAVWDVGRGDIHIDDGVLQRSHDYFKGPASIVMNRFAAILPHHLSHIAGGNRTNQVKVEEGWLGLATKASTAALMAAFASQIPIWFCIACPIVLGLLAPFVFNLGFGAAANLLCEHYRLPAQECNDLWYGAFAVAMVLSLASAIPIVYICQLPRCGRSAWH